MDEPYSAFVVAEVDVPKEGVWADTFIGHREIPADIVDRFCDAVDLTGDSQERVIIVKRKPGARKYSVLVWAKTNREELVNEIRSVLMGVR